jgi:hypothetical protein
MKILGLYFNTLLHFKYFDFLFRFSRPTDDHAHHSELNDDDEDRSEGDVFIEDSPIKSPTNIIRHQSVINLPNNVLRRFQQQPSNAIRRHVSQCSADEFPPADRRYPRSKENPEFIQTNTLKKKSSPITLITRKNQINHDEQNVYEAPHSEQTHTRVSNSHTLKKTRPFHTITATGNSHVNGQHNNKQISKQILHAIMHSMNNNQEPSITTGNDAFFEHGPLTNPEETVGNISPST